MTELRTIVLPEIEEMQRRLISVDNTEYMSSKFYPLLTEYAGREMEILGVVHVLVLAVTIHSEGKPPMFSKVLFMRLPEFVKALIDDEEMRSEILQEMRAIGIIR